MPTDNHFTFDAIVIGSGMTGGWAAKELTEQGLSVLVLERGRMVEHGKDYTTAHKDTWDLPFHGKPSQADIKQQYKQARSPFLLNQAIKHWFVNDLDHPYNESKRFDWHRGYHVGGKSLNWGRQCLRLSEQDFCANKDDGHGIDWPVRYQDIAPWYDKVEQYIGVIGESLSLPQLPDGKFLPAMPLNCVEQDFRQKLKQEYSDRTLTIGRVAHLTKDTSVDGKKFEGRSKCQYRNRCMRGCPSGSYFSANASTLPAAKRTGRLTLRTDAIVSEICYDGNSKLATGVKVIDANSHEILTFNAKIIFCCASTIPTTSLLLQSRSQRFPNGLGNDSGELGHNLMDHHFQVGARADIEGFDNKYYKGRRPVGFHIPRFRNLDQQSKPQAKQKKESLDFVRGYGFQGYCSRSNWQRGIKEMSFGKELKESLLKPGSWRIGLVGFGECLPYHDNKITLNYQQLDQWGLPTVVFDCQFKENEKRMRADMKAQAVEMLSKAGYDNVTPYEKEAVPGHAIHEMGTARMGHDPKTSVVNKHNQLHAVANVYVTDGSFMASSAYQNPSLTYMAFTARAAAHAVKQFKLLEKEYA